VERSLVEQLFVISALVLIVVMGAVCITLADKFRFLEYEKSFVDYVKRPFYLIFHKQGFFVEEKEVYYDIKGSSLQELKNQIERWGPGEGYWRNAFGMSSRGSCLLRMSGKAVYFPILA